MSRPAWAEIDLGALKHNLGVVRQTAPDSNIMAVIKANGYGHGLLRVARALSGADALGVASIDEAMQLRENGIDQRLVLLEGVFESDELPLVEQQRLDIVIHDMHQLDMLAAYKAAGRLRVWLKVDTGMHRLGLSPESVKDAIGKLRQITFVETPLVVMTHLANADTPGDDYTAGQLNRFDALMSTLGDKSEVLSSVCNSGGVLACPQSHGDWVRPGIMLYGISPFTGRTGKELGLKPAMRFKSRLIEVKRVAAGQPVGYGGTWTCPKEMNIGVVAVGYGDGYPRHAVNGTQVLVNGRVARLAGRVSMDMITVDLSGNDNAAIGDEVELWGDNLAVETVADSADTIAYELVCGVTQRVRFLEVEK